MPTGHVNNVSHGAESTRDISTGFTWSDCLPFLLHPLGLRSQSDHPLALAGLKQITHETDISAGKHSSNPLQENAQSILARKS